MPKKLWRGPMKAPVQVADVDVRSGLERINARASIPIETAPGSLPPIGRGDPDGTDSYRAREEFLQEVHHRQYGRPWAGGKCIFDFARKVGLAPDDRLLDFGCGALRFGIWAIPFLEAGHYFGVDSHLMSLEAAVTYEIPFHGLAEKRPRLLWNDRCEFSYFDTEITFVVDYSSSIFVKPKERAFSAFSSVVSPGGDLLTGPELPLPVTEIARHGFELVDEAVVHECPLLAQEGAAQSVDVWWHFIRA